MGFENVGGSIGEGGWGFGDGGGSQTPVVIKNKNTNLDSKWDSYQSGFDAASSGDVIDFTLAQSDPNYLKGYQDYIRYQGTVNQAEDYYNKQRQEGLIDKELESLNKQEERNKLLEPYLLAQSGYKIVKDAKGNETLVKLTEDEMLANMSPLEKKQYELAMLQYEDAMKAQRGEIEIPAWMQEELDKQKQIESTRLNQRLGPAAFLSSAGIQTEDATNKRIAGLKDQYAHGEKLTANQLASGTTSGLMNYGGYNNNLLSGGLNSTGLMGQYGGMYSQLGGSLTSGNALPYWQMYQQQDLQNRANRYGLMGDYIGAIGALGGAGLGGWLAKE